MPRLCCRRGGAKRSAGETRGASSCSAARKPPRRRLRVTWWKRSSSNQALSCAATRWLPAARPSLPSTSRACVFWVLRKMVCTCELLVRDRFGVPISIRCPRCLAVTQRVGPSVGCTARNVGRALLPFVSRRALLLDVWNVDHDVHLYTLHAASSCHPFERPDRPLTVFVAFFFTQVCYTSAQHEVVVCMVIGFGCRRVGYRAVCTPPTHTHSARAAQSTTTSRCDRAVLRVFRLSET